MPFRQSALSAPSKRTLLHPRVATEASSMHGSRRARNLGHRRPLQPQLLKAPLLAQAKARLPPSQPNPRHQPVQLRRTKLPTTRKATLPTANPLQLPLTPSRRLTRGRTSPALPQRVLPLKVQIRLLPRPLPTLLVLAPPLPSPLRTLVALPVPPPSPTTVLVVTSSTVVWPSPLFLLLL